MEDETRSKAKVVLECFNGVVDDYGTGTRRASVAKRPGSKVKLGSVR